MLLMTIVMKSKTMMNRSSRFLVLNHEIFYIYRQSLYIWTETKQRDYLHIPCKKWNTTKKKRHNVFSTFYFLLIHQKNWFYMYICVLVRERERKREKKIKLEYFDDDVLSCWCVYPLLFYHYSSYSCVSFISYSFVFF